MADARLGHDRDADHFHNFFNNGGVGHTGHAARGADVGGHALQGHDGAGARVFGYLGLFGRGRPPITPPLSISAKPVLRRMVPCLKMHPCAGNRRTYLRNHRGAGDIYANTPLLTILRLALPPATGYAFAQRRKDAAYHY